MRFGSVKGLVDALIVSLFGLNFVIAPTGTSACCFHEGSEVAVSVIVFPEYLIPGIL